MPATTRVPYGDSSSSSPWRSIPISPCVPQRAHRPPRSLLEHVQSVVARMVDDPDINPRRVYHFTAPLFAFISILLASVTLPRLAFVQMCLCDIPRFKVELALMILLFFAAVGGGLVGLRWLVKKVAVGARIFAEYDFGGLNKEAGVPQSYELIFGGIL